MTKFEKKILDLLTAHRVILAYAVITVLNLYLRKVAVWWNTEGIECYYDGHTHMVQGQLWWLIMRLGMVFPILPVHFMKWVATLGDFAMGAAGACVVSKKSAVRGLVFYAVVLIMPFTLMRGIVWGLTDSLGIACVIAGMMIAGRGHGGKSGKCEFVWFVLAHVMALLFCPALVIPFCVEGIVACCKKESKKAEVFACAVLCVAVIAGVLGIVNGFGFMQGLLGQVNFIKYEALSGTAFGDVKAWALAQAGNYVLPVVTVGLVRVCDK